MDGKRIEEIRSREVVTLLNKSEEIVISGIGGRFPMSNGLDEFAENLYNNVDMITEDANEERWPKGIRIVYKLFISMIFLIFN